MNTGRRRAAARAAGVLLVALAGPASAGATEPAMPDQDPPPSTPIVEFRDVGAMGTVGRGDLVLLSDGRAWTLVEGEAIVLELPASEAAALQEDLAAALAGLPAELPSFPATDQPQTLIRVAGSDGEPPRTVRVSGADAPENFREAATRLAALAERIRGDGRLDPAVPITVSLIREGRLPDGPAVTWPAAAPVPAFGDQRVAYATYTAEAAAGVRAALGPAGMPVLVELPDGTPAAARWQAVLPFTD